MNANYLFLVDTGSALSSEQVCGLPDVSREKLVNISKNTELSLFLREPAIQELAHRRDSAVIEICNSFARRRDFDSWFVVVRALAHLGTRSAKDALLAMGINCDSNRLRILVIFLGRLVEETDSQSFSKLIQGIAKPTSLDISGWTKAAFRSLRNVHRIHGTRMIWNSSRKMTEQLTDFVSKTGKNRQSDSNLGSHKPVRTQKNIFR